MDGPRLTLQPGQWYGWTMWPGYGDTPYHSPIRVEHIRAHQDGSRRFDLHFLNAGYANGVQMMTYELRTLIRREFYLLADVPMSERSVAIVPLTLEWCRIQFPDSYERIHRAVTKHRCEIGEAIAALM